MEAPTTNPTTPPKRPSSSPLSLVHPLSRDLILSRQVPLTGQTVNQAAGIPSPTPAASALESDPFATSLVPSSDLTLLLSDPALRRRYREGRYVPGKNAAIKFSSWPTCLSVTSKSIAQKCEPRASTSILAAITLHIGTRHLMTWEPITHLKEIQDTYYFDSPTLSGIAVRSVKHLLDRLLPPAIGRLPKTIVVSDGVEMEFTALCDAAGVPGWIMAPYCCIATLRQQPAKYLNVGLREEMDRRMDELWRWLRFRCRMVEAAVEEFDGAGLDTTISK